MKQNKMQAVEIRASIGEHEDTDLDLPRRSRSRRFSIRRSPVAAPRSRAVVEQPPTNDRNRAPLPRSTSSRLLDLQFEESVGRKSARRFSSRFEPSICNGAPKPIAVIRIDWIRSDDAGQSALAAGTDGFAICGDATGTVARGRRPTRRGTSVAVGVDGLIYTVRLNPGDSPEETVERLTERLGRRYNLDISHDSDDCTVVRLSSEKLRAEV